MATVEIGDSLVQVGNIKPDSGRQNAIYLTSSDDQAPYINILSDLNRPDYSVLYKIPKYDEDGNPITKKDEEGNFIEYEFEYTKTTKVRIGNLGGIIDYTFPADKQPRGYGLYGQNVYLTGEFYLNNGKSVVDVSQDGIILKYKDAGLSIEDDPNDNTKTLISLNANKIKLSDGSTDLGTVFSIENGRAYIRTTLIKAEEIVTRTVICRDSEGNIVSAINKEGDGAFRLYYPDTGKVQMEFKATATNGLIASYRPDGYLNWKIGANAGFITNSIDSWEIIKLFATTVDGHGIQTMNILPGTNFYTFMASYGSPLAAYKGLTMKYGYPTSTAPTGVTAEMKIPDGWYAYPGPPYEIPIFDENLPTRYARWLMRYENGFEVETREFELDIDPNGGIGWLE